MSAATRECTVCGMPFVPPSNRHRRCSDDCRREAWRRTSRAWSEKNRHLHAERIRRFRAKNPLACKSYMYKSKYGISLAEVEALLKSQNNQCQICEMEIAIEGKTGNKSKAVIDHCHKTNAVRGILCTWCNCMLGYAEDDPQRFARASAYLESSK